MGNVVNFDFSSEKIKEIIEKTKKKVVQVCQNCGHKFYEDTSRIENGQIKIICPKCGSDKVKVVLEK